MKTEDRNGMFTEQQAGEYLRKYFLDNGMWMYVAEDSEMITLKEIRVILAVCRAGSFIGAGRLLNTTQSNVSKIVAQTEERLGVKLFVRLSGGIKLTGEGEYVRLYAERIARLTEKIEQVAKRKNDSSDRF